MKDKNRNVTGNLILSILYSPFLPPILSSYILGSLYSQKKATDSFISAITISPPDVLSSIVRTDLWQTGLNVKSWEPLKCSVLFDIDENFDSSSEVSREKNLRVICLKGS